MMEDDPINFHQAIQSSYSQKWIDSMNEEYKPMKTLMFGILSHYLKVRNPLVANGYLKPRGIRKVMWRDIRHVLLLLKRKALILKRLFQ